MLVVVKDNNCRGDNMTKDSTDMIRAVYSGWCKAIVVSWGPDEKTKSNFFQDIAEQSPEALIDILSIMNLEYIEKVPAKVIHYISDKNLIQSGALDIASKYVKTAAWMRQLYNFNDEKIDPAMLDEWSDFKQKILSADEEFFQGDDLLAKALYCMADVAKLINEYDESANNPEMLAKFSKNLAQANILNFVRYCPNGSEIALANLPQDLVTSCNYKRFFKSIDEFKDKKLNKIEVYTKC